MDDKLEALAASDLFAGLGKKELDAIAKVTDRVTVHDGRMLVHQGAVTTHMSIIIEGSATVTVDDEEVATLGPGDVVGELSMIDGERASATVTANGDCTIWLIARAGFLPVFERHPEMAVSMLHAVVKRLRSADEIIKAHRH